MRESASERLNRLLALVPYLLAHPGVPPDEACDAFGIDVMKSREVVEAERTRPLPDTLEYMRGVIDLRGAIVPVVDLKKKMGLGDNGDRWSAVVILEVHGSLVGVAVDAVIDVTGIAEEDIQRTPHFARNADGDAVRGMARVNGRTVVIIDAEKMLTEQEMKGFAAGA